MTLDAPDAVDLQAFVAGGNSPKSDIPRPLESW